MNSTQTGSAPSFRAKYVTSQLWLAVLEQTDWWVPRGAWDAFGSASVQVGPVRPNFDVPGLVRTAEMDVAWRQSVLRFMWRKSAAITFGQSLAGLFVSGSDYGPDHAWDEDASFADLARDEVRRRVWFDRMPLVSHLRAAVIEDRDARLPRTVLLESATPVPHPSGLALVTGS